MHDALHQQRFDNLLRHSSQTLDHLLDQVRRFEPTHIPLELLDEIACTIGELTLVLTDHLAIQHTQELTQSVISHAQLLRKHVRSQALNHQELAFAVGSLSEEINLIIRQDKRAA